MNIVKMAHTAAAGEYQRDELEAINCFAKTKLKAEDVYTFSIILCDNDIDRDMERFDDSTLRELAELFVGKTLKLTAEAYGKDAQHMVCWAIAY